jgi:hypothetical protein
VDHGGKFSSPIIKFGFRNQNSALEKRNPVEKKGVRKKRVQKKGAKKKGVF